MSAKTSIVLSILPLILLAAVVFHFSLDLPYWDQWEFVPLLQKFYENRLSFSDFWVLHNEHRPVFPRLIMLGLARLTNWNIRYELALNILLGIGIYTVILKSFITPPYSPSYFKRGLGGVISLIVFSLTQWENWVWGWQIMIFLNVLTVCLGFYLLTRRRIIASIICGIIATFSFANGLLFWPIGFFVLLSLTRAAPARLAWLVITILVYAIYLPGIPTQFGLFTIINNILLYLSYVTAYLGAPVFGLHPIVASIFGILGLVIFLISARKNHSIFFLSLGLYAILSAFFTALGRYNPGGLQAISSRYITFGNLLWISDIVFLVVTRGRTRSIAILLIVILITATSLYRIKTITRRYNELSQGEKSYEKLYYSGEVVKERMKFLREKFSK